MSSGASSARESYYWLSLVFVTLTFTHSLSLLPYYFRPSIAFRILACYFLSLSLLPLIQVHFRTLPSFLSIPIISGSGGGAAPFFSFGFCGGGVGKNLNTCTLGLPMLGDQFPRNFLSAIYICTVNKTRLI